MKKFIPVLILILAAASTFAQSPDTVAPNENLIVQGIPAVPAEIAARANQYTESRAAVPLDWNPLKREMLISTRFADVPQIHELKMPGGARTQLTFFPRPHRQRQLSTA